MSYDIYDRVNNTGNGGYSGKSTGDKRANWAIGLAIAGLFCCGGIFSIIAIILGALALGDAYCRNRGRAIAAIIIGIFEIIFWVVLSASIAVSIGNTDTDLSGNLVYGDPPAIIEIEETEKPVGNNEANREYLEVTVTKLLDELDSNALRAEQTYQDKYVKVEGQLDGIDSDGEYITICEVGEELALFDTIHCNITSEEQRDTVMNKNSGDKIVVYGQITTIGEVLGYYLDIEKVE